MFAFILLVVETEGEESPFNADPTSITKIISMMVGELEYQDTFPEQSWIVLILFLFFVGVVPVIINNLLIGLTVDNIQDLLKNAQLRSLEKRLEIIIQLDKNSKLLKDFKLFRSFRFR